MSGRIPGEFSPRVSFYIEKKIPAMRGDLPAAFPLEGKDAQVLGKKSRKSNLEIYLAKVERACYNKPTYSPENFKSGCRRTGEGTELFLSTWTAGGAGFPAYFRGRTQAWQRAGWVLFGESAAENAVQDKGDVLLCFMD